MGRRAHMMSAEWERGAASPSQSSFFYPPPAHASSSMPPALPTGRVLRPPYNPHNALTQVFAGLDPHSPSTSPAGPLHSLRYAAKENICTKRGSTTCSSQILGARSQRPYVSPFDSTCIKLLDSAGASLAAKTNMDEFGMGSFTTNSAYGATLNPHCESRTSGGSSGGSAAALFMSSDDFPGLDFTLGTDTGGSVRIPASYCGLYGFKPSYGRISRWGVVPYANSLDTVGIMARKESGLGVIKKVFEVLDHYDAADPTSLKSSVRERIGKQRQNKQRAGKMRIGVPRAYNVEELSPAVLKTWRASLDRLVEAGHEIIPVSLPLTQTALSAYYILAPSEASSNLQKYSGVFFGARSDQDRSEGRLFAATRNLFGSEVKRRILMGCLSLSADMYDNYYLQAQRVRRLIVEEFNRTFSLVHPLIPSIQDDEGVDYLVTPVTATTAPLFTHIDNLSSTEAHVGDVFTVPANMAGLPSISVPFGADEDGLPIGVQLIGQYGDDVGLLDAAEALQ